LFLKLYPKRLEEELNDFCHKERERNEKLNVLERKAKNKIDGLNIGKN